MQGESAPPIVNPAGYVTTQVMAIDLGDGSARAIGAANPLPTTQTVTAARSTPLSGTTGATGLFGPFAPELNRAIWVALDGVWSGTVQVRRSTDAGATTTPLTLAGQPWATFTANAQEPIGEETAAGATYYLSVTLSSGTLSYRIAQ